VLRELLCAPLDLHMVGDVRQALIATNIQDPKNSQYKGVKIVNWFEEQAKRGLLTMTREYTTWRCSQAVASFADTIFDASWKFPPTVSNSLTTIGHQGVFAVAPEHVEEYVRRFRPLCLRHSVSSAKNLELPFENIGAVKGAGADHVLIGPTAGMLEFLRSTTYQGETPSCSLYVAVTRARSSVAFVCSTPEDLKLPVWTP
jgi:DNA helicase II / ATP-dependent DNA helicase PcrA